MRASIEKLTRRIQSLPHLDEAEREELLGLVGGIAEEVGELPEDEDGAGEGEPHPVKRSVSLLAEEEPTLPGQIHESILKVEAAYPKTAAALGRVAHVLSRMGI